MNPETLFKVTVYEPFTDDGAPEDSPHVFYVEHQSSQPWLALNKVLKVYKKKYSRIEIEIKKGKIIT